MPGHTCHVGNHQGGQGTEGARGNGARALIVVSTEGTERHGRQTEDWLGRIILVGSGEQGLTPIIRYLALGDKSTQEWVGWARDGWFAYKGCPGKSYHLWELAVPGRAVPAGSVRPQRAKLPNKNMFDR